MLSLSSSLSDGRCTPATVVGCDSCIGGILEGPGAGVSAGGAEVGGSCASRA